MQTSWVFRGAVFCSIAGIATLAGCDIVAGVGTYCVEGKDPGCGGTGTAGTGAAGGGTTAGGGAATSTGGGTGGAPECIDGAMRECYTGPSGTEGVGICHAGAQTCLTDSTWGPCEGAALPGVETCASNKDEDCDNAECAIWSRVFGDASMQSPLDVAVDGDGNVVVAGYFTGEMLIDGTPFSAGATNNIFLLKFGPDGGLVWGKSLGDAANQISAHVAVDSAGNVVLAGNFQGQIDFENGQIVTNSDPSSDDIFVAKFNSDGTSLWAHSYGDAAEQELDDVVVDELGDIGIVGAFKGTINLGKGNLVALGSSYDVLVAKIASTGTTVWNKQYGDSSSQFARRVAVDSGGDFYVVGQFGGTIDFGDGVQTETTPGGTDIFLVKLAAGAGNLVSKRILPSGSVVIPTGLGVTASGDVTLTADFSGKFDVGGVTYVPNGTSDVFVAQYAPNWTLSWSHQVGGGSSKEGSSGLAIAPNGDVSVTMTSDGGVDFGGGALISAGASDVFVGKYNATGQYLWSRHFGDAEAQLQPQITSFADGSLAVACRTNGTLNFGAGDLASSGDDVAVAKLAP